MVKNEITGASLVTKPSSEAYREGWSVIFEKKDSGKENSILEKKEQIILINKAMCDSCHEVIRSEHRNDYVRCSCGNLSVDGGASYIKRNCGNAGFTELSFCADEDDIETIRDYFTWSSYGKNGDEPKKTSLLKNLDTLHIEAILRTQYHIRGTHVEKFFEMEVKYREMLYDKELQYRKDNDL